MIDNKYGAKCDRILHLKKSNNIGQIIPKTYPISYNLLEGLYIDDCNYEEAVTKATEYISNSQGSVLSDSIINECGCPPWIIRSSGEEDTDETSNAGAYESIVCNYVEELYKCIAAVMLCGKKTRTLKQHQVVNKYSFDSGKQMKVISAFVQPLIKSKSKEEKEQLPYLNSSQLVKIKKYLLAIHDEIKSDVLDCEWVILSSQGTVSATSFTEKSSCGIIGQISFGFGLFSSQAIKDKNNSTLFLIDDLEMWQGKYLCDIGDDININLVQVRPNHNYHLTMTMPKIENVKILDDLQKFRTDNILVPCKNFRYGRYIACKSLNAAWEKYITMSINERKQIGSVFVEYGNRNEHAGIMFAEENIVVAHLSLKLIPSDCNYALVDQFSYFCYFTETDKIFKSLEINYKQNISIPKDAQIVFDRVSFSDAIFKSLRYYDEFKKLEVNPYIIDSLKMVIKHNSEHVRYESLLKQNDDIYSPTVMGRFIDLNMEDALIELMHEDILYRSSLDIIKNKNKLESTFEFLQISNGLTYFYNIKILLQLFIIKSWYSLNKYESINISDVLKNCQNEQDTLYILECLNILHSRIENNIILDRNEKKNLYILFCNKVIKIQDFRHIKSLLSNEFISIFLEVNLCENANIMMNYNKLCDLFDVCSNLLIMNPEEFNTLNSYFLDLQKNIEKSEWIADIINIVFLKIIELYDKKAKDIALTYSLTSNVEYYNQYTMILKKWLSLLNLLGFDVDIVAALENTLSYDMSDSKMYLDFISTNEQLHELKNNNVKIVKNIHQLHNILHQWSLMNAKSINTLPRKLKKMIHIANQSGNKNKKILCLEDNGFEIEQETHGHKSSIIFRNNHIHIEHNEAPGSKDYQIGRLFVFNEFINNRFNSWYPKYNFHSYNEKILGTWYILISISSKNGEFTKNDFEKIFNIFTFLFDASIDYGHHPNELSNDISQRFLQKEWKPLFNSIVQYRKHMQHPQKDIRSFAISTIFTELTKFKYLEDYYLSIYNRGFNSVEKEIMDLDNLLSNVTDYSVWRQAYNKINVLALLLSSIWKNETQKLIKKVSEPYKIVSYIINRNIALRDDVTTYNNKKEKGIFSESFIVNYITKCLDDESGSYLEKPEETISNFDQEEITNVILRIESFFEFDMQYKKEKIEPSLIKNILHAQI